MPLSKLSNLFFQFLFLIFAFGVVTITVSNMSPVFATHEECCPYDTHGADIYGCHIDCTAGIGGRIVNESGQGVGGIQVHLWSWTWVDTDEHGNPTDGHYDYKDDYPTTDGNGYYGGQIYTSDGAENFSVTPNQGTIPAGYTFGGSTTTGWSWRSNCGGGDTAYGSASYDCQHYSSGGGGASCAGPDGIYGQWNRCNFKVQYAKPPTPTISLNGACSGTDGRYYGDQISITWSGTSPGVSYVDMRDANNGGWQNGWINRYVGGATSTTAIANGWQVNYLNFNELQKPDSYWKL